MTAPGQPQFIPMIENFVNDQNVPPDLPGMHQRVNDLGRIVQVTQNTTQQALNVVENAVQPLQQGFTALNTNIGDGSEVANMLRAWNTTQLPNVQQEITDVRNEMNNRMGSVEGTVAQIGISVADIQNQFTTHGDMNYVSGQIGIVQQQIQRIEQLLQAQDLRIQNTENRGGIPTGTGSSHRIITEYKSWDNIENLENDRSIFRVWKRKFKGIFKLISKVPWHEEVFKAVESIEIGKQMWNMQQSEFDRILRDAMANLRNQNALIPAMDMPLHNDLKTMEQELDAVLQGKVGDKSQAAVLWNRSEGNGIYAWAQIHNWYIQTSGEGMMAKRTRVMYPKEIKNIDSMMYEVQAWLDEIKELELLGDRGMEPEYKITTLKNMVPESVRKDMADDIREMFRENKRPEEMFSILVNKTLDLGKDHMIWKTEGMKSNKSGSIPMDTSMNQAGPPIPPGFENGFQGMGKGPGQYQYPPNGPGAYAMGPKGGGKGMYQTRQPMGKGGGKQFGGKNGYWSKNGGPTKGPKGGKGQYSAPYFHNCKGCGKPGHSWRNCPKEGKGFKAACDYCKYMGHPKSLCPFLHKDGKGKGGINNVDGEPQGMSFGGGNSESDKDDQKQDEPTQGSNNPHEGWSSQNNEWNAQYDTSAQYSNFAGWPPEQYHPGWGDQWYPGM